MNSQKVQSRSKRGETYQYQKSALEKSIPRIILVIHISIIKKNWPLVSWYCQLIWTKLLSSPVGCQKGQSWKLMPYSRLKQSKLAGHKSAPVRSWWNPRSIFMLRAKGRFKNCPCRVIQLRMAPFRLLVSSDLALEAHFWSLAYINMLRDFERIVEYAQAQQYVWLHHLNPPQSMSQDLR